MRQFVGAVLVAALMLTKCTFSARPSALSPTESPLPAPTFASTGPATHIPGPAASPGAIRTLPAAPAATTPPPAASATSPDAEWKRLAFEGASTASVVDAGSVLFAGVDGDLLKSVDGGGSWAPSGDGLQGPSCPRQGGWQVVADRSSATRLYAVAQGITIITATDCPARVARSDDSAATWVPLDLPRLKVPYIDSDLLPTQVSLHVHPTSGDVWVWEFIRTDPRSGGAERLLRSGDGGATWAEAPLPPGYGTLPNRRVLGFHQTPDAVWLYATVQDVYYMTTGMSPIYLYRSRDGTGQWEKVVLPASVREMAFVRGRDQAFVAVSEAANLGRGDVELYALRGGEAERIGWLPAVSPIYLPVRLLVDPEAPDRLFCVPSGDNVESVWVSEDGGLAWTEITLPEPQTVQNACVLGTASRARGLALSTSSGAWVLPIGQSSLPARQRPTATALAVRATATASAVLEQARFYENSSPPSGRFAADPAVSRAWQTYGIDMHAAFAYSHPGWALGPAEAVELAVQEFAVQGGYLNPVGGCHPDRVLLLWRADTRVIYMLPEAAAGIRWPYQILACLPTVQEFVDAWQPAMPNNEDLKPPFSGYVVPRFGIGKVWREQFYDKTGDALSLYFPREDERHLQAVVQEFDNAIIFYREDTKEFYTLFRKFPHLTPDGNEVVESPVWFVVR